MDDDQDKVAAWLRAKADTCPECGTRQDDWADSRGRHLDVPLWEATTVRCFGCEAIAVAAGDIPSGQKGVRVMLRPAAPSDEQGG